MANLKITELPEQTATPAVDDMYVIVDVSDPVPTNQTKKIRSDKVYVHGAAQLAANVVETAKIKDRNVTVGKIAVGANGQTLMTGASGVAWVTHVNAAHYTSTSWDGDVKSVGTYDLNLNTVFGVPTGVVAVLVKAGAKWQAASDGSFMEVKYGVNFRGIVMRALVANFNIDGYGLILVPTNGIIRVEIGGANTLATTLEIEGYLL